MLPPGRGAGEMIDRIRRWLRGAFDRRSQVSAAPITTRGVVEDVPTDAINLARRLLAVCLTSLGAKDRISEISEMRVAPYRHLIELLPLRVYVYSLGSPMAQMDYESILSSNRPAGTVFDGFELPFRDVRCGFYVYSLAPVKAATLSLLWRNLREEVGQPVKTADLPALHLRHHRASDADDAPSAASSDAESPLGMIPLNSDAEVIVRKLVGERPASQQLATYNLVSAQDIMRPISAFLVTRNEYPFEREQLIDFVHRNAGILRSSVDFLDQLKLDLQDYNEDREQVDAMRNLIDVFCRQSKLVLVGREAEVDVRSETIYWLIVILSSQVNQRMLSLDAAVAYLERKHYRVRLGAATLAVTELLNRDVGQDSARLRELRQTLKENLGSLLTERDQVLDDVGPVQVNEVVPRGAMLCDHARVLARSDRPRCAALRRGRRVMTSPNAGFLAASRNDDASGSVVYSQTL
jgi:hypothetical protein